MSPLLSLLDTILSSTINPVIATLITSAPKKASALVYPSRTITAKEPFMLRPKPSSFLNLSTSDTTTPPPQKSRLKTKYLTAFRSSSKFPKYTPATNCNYQLKTIYNLRDILGKRIDNSPSPSTLSMTTPPKSVPRSPKPKTTPKV